MCIIILKPICDGNCPSFCKSFKLKLNVNPFLIQINGRRGFANKIHLQERQILVRDAPFDSPFNKKDPKGSEQGESSSKPNPTSPSPPIPAPAEVTTELLSSMVSLVSLSPGQLAGAHATQVHSSPEDMEFNRIKSTYANMNGDFAPEAMAGSLLSATPALESTSLSFAPSVDVNTLEADFEVVDGTTIFFDAQPQTSDNNGSSKSIAPTLMADVDVVVTKVPETNEFPSKTDEPAQAEIRPSSSIEYRSSPSVDAPTPEVEKTSPQAFNEAPSTAPPINPGAPSAAAAQPVVQASHVDVQMKTVEPTTAEETQTQKPKLEETNVEESQTDSPQIEETKREDSQTVVEDILTEKPFEKEIIAEKPFEKEIIVEKPFEKEIIAEKPLEGEIIVEKAIHEEILTDKPTLTDTISNENFEKTKTEQPTSEASKTDDPQEDEVKIENGIVDENKHEVVKVLEDVVNDEASTEENTAQVEKQTEDNIDLNLIESEKDESEGSLSKEERKRIIREELLNVQPDVKEGEAVVLEKSQETEAPKGVIENKGDIIEENKVIESEKDGNDAVLNDAATSKINKETVHELVLDFKKNEKSEYFPTEVTQPHTSIEKVDPNLTEQTKSEATEEMVPEKLVTVESVPDKVNEGPSSAEIVELTSERATTDTPVTTGFFGDFFGSPEPDQIPSTTETVPTLAEVVPALENSSATTETNLNFDQPPPLSFSSDEIKFYEPGQAPDKFATSFEESNSGSAQSSDYLSNSLGKKRVETLFGEGKICMEM